jgi:ubiquinone/menaquinone biosynthesis C-methylase UbiE
MNFFDLKDISERYLELVNPTSPEKVLLAGQVLGLQTGQRVIDFGSGLGEVLALWAENFGIEGVGIDIRWNACRRAKEKMTTRGLNGRIEIVCRNANEYSFDANSYDVAACIGATFIWDGGFRAAIQVLKKAIHPHGKLIVGEAHSKVDVLPVVYARKQQLLTELELLQIIREEGFELEYIIRASQDEWDRYESGNWVGLLRWIETNPEHPERGQVIDHLRESQEEYLRFIRQYIGWAMYILTPCC